MIDGAILQLGPGHFALLYKDERPDKQNLWLAWSDRPTGNYVNASIVFAPSQLVEGHMSFR